MSKLKDDLSNYNHNKYQKPSVTVDIIICTIMEGTLKVLLIKRKQPPFKDSWAIPGGFVDIAAKETLEETALRELKEETNLEGIFIEQLKSYGDPDRDPRLRVITVAYYALVPYECQFKSMRAGDDAKEAAWFNLNKPPSEMAFDHAKILQDALVRIQGKVLYSPIAFKLVPKKFTWSVLQTVYEIILGYKVSNFRRKMRSLYKILPMKERVLGRGRPKVLLQYKGLKEQI
jgi:8-oxo-dGTP diphosphatase